jgi:hypothetical protein
LVYFVQLGVYDSPPTVTEVVGVFVHYGFIIISTQTSTVGNILIFYNLNLKEALTQNFVVLCFKITFELIF